MAYTLCFQAPKPDHRLFMDERGRVSICDNSGDRPEVTDDGPLVIEPGSKVSAYLSTIGGTSPLYFSVPVLCTRDMTRSACHVTPTVMRAIAERVPGLTVEFGPGVARLAEDLGFAMFGLRRAA